MDELIKAFSFQGGKGDQIGIIESLAALALSWLCAWIIAKMYRLTYKGTSYSPSFVQSLVLVSLVTTLIMIVIGSNIARAFSLIGALSIIRFRNAIKDTRDVAFIFFVMAIAMGCGTRFYALAFVATLINSGVIWIMHLTNFGASEKAVERLLSIQFPPNVDPQAVLEPVLTKFFQSFSLVSIESVRQGLFTEVVYSVQPLPGFTGKQVLDEIAQVNGNLKINYNYSVHQDEI